MSRPLISRRDALGLGAATSLALTDNGWAKSSASASHGVRALGYVIMPGEDLDAWSAWAPQVFGLQLADRSATTRVFRMDDHLYRLAIDQKAQKPTLGWEVADAGALDALAARLEAAGVKVVRGSRALISQRGVRDLVTLTDPAGIELEIFHGPALASTPFQPGRAISGFRTGPLGMGHIVVFTEPARFEETSSFYLKLLGFRLSDYLMANGAVALQFMHVNPREHSFALGAFGSKTQIHHIMMEMLFLDDVGQAYDIAFKEYRSRINTTIGRHTNDLMTSFYIRTPSDFLMECGWGGLSVDPERWQAAELTAGTKIWGHHPMKDGLPVDEVRQMAIATPPLRAPLQVYGENFETGHQPRDLTQVLKTKKST